MFWTACFCHVSTGDKGHRWVPPPPGSSGCAPQRAGCHEQCCPPVLAAKGAPHRARLWQPLAASAGCREPCPCGWSPAEALRVREFVPEPSCSGKRQQRPAQDAESSLWGVTGFSSSSSRVVFARGKPGLQMGTITLIFSLVALSCFGCESFGSPDEMYSTKRAAWQFWLGTPHSLVIITICSAIDCSCWLEQLKPWGGLKGRTEV